MPLAAVGAIVTGGAEQVPHLLCAALGTDGLPVSIADCFKAAGYATGSIGKWHNGTFDRRYEPNARGFDELVGFCGGWSDYYSYQLRRNNASEASSGTYMTAS